MKNSTIQNPVNKIVNGMTTILFAFLFVLAFSGVSNAQISVVTASGGSAISSDKAADGPSNAYTTLLGGIKICETTTSDFAANQANVTLIFSAPSGWVFAANSGVLSRTSHGSFTGTTNITITTSTITITFSTGADVNNFKDTLSINSVQVKASTGAVLPDAGNITKTGGTCVLTNGGLANGTVMASLGLVAGSVDHFKFDQDVNNVNHLNSPQQVNVGFNTTITAQDFFNHTATGFAGSANLTTNTGAISPSLSGAFVAGVKTVNISLNTSGNGVTVTATNSTHTGTSNGITVNAGGIIPQGSLTANGPFCVSGAGLLTWTESSGTGPYTIIYNDGVANRTASGVVSATPFAVFTTPVTSTTTYTLVSVTDAGSNMRNNSFTVGSRTITINPLPAATITAGSSTTFCQGGSVTLTSSTGTNYLWSPGGATTSSINSTASVTFTVKVTDANGCSATSSGTVVTVNPLPTATITPGSTTTFCQGGSVTLTSSAGSSYLWSPGGATISAIYVSSSGTYTVRVTDANSCSNTSSGTVVTVNPLPTATITAGGATTFCQGGSVTLTSSAGSSYLWSPGGATISAIYVSSSGTYTVRVTDANSCSNTSSGTVVTVNPLPTATITAGSSTTFCQGGSVTLTSSAGSSYLWSPGGATTSAINVSSSGSYTVRVTDANSCSATSSGSVVTVNPLPTATITAGGATTICQGGSVTLTSSAGSSYLWSPGGATTSAINASSSGTYTVRVTDANSCSNTSSGTVVTVNPLPQGSLSANGPFCGSGAGQLTWGAATGTGPFTVVYYDGVSNRTASSVTSGTPFNVFTSPVTGTTTYTLVSVTDVYTCSRNSSFTGATATITINPAISYAANPYDACADTASPCHNSNNGFININPSTNFDNVGTPPYSATINNVLFNASFTSQITVSNLVANTYNILITDANGCTATNSVVLDNLLPITFSPSVSDVTCFGGSDGIITLNNLDDAVGGHNNTCGPGWSYSYTLIPSFSSFTPNVIPSLPAGDYYLQAADYLIGTAAGCTSAVQHVVVGQPAVLSATVNHTNVTCNGGSNGTITVSSPTGGYGTYEFKVDASAWQSSGSFSGFLAGSHDVKIRDAVHTACVIDLGNTTITEPIPSIACAVSGNVNNTATHCYYSVNGAEFNPDITTGNCGSGYTTSYTVSGATTLSGSTTLANAQLNNGANTITWTVTDINRHTNSCSFVVTVMDNEAPVAICQAVTVHLDGNGNGSVTTTDVDNGSHDNCGIVSRTVNNASSVSYTCSNLGANTVTLKVTDAANNTATCSASISVVDNIAPVAHCHNVTIYLDGNGNASVTANQVDNGSTDNCGITGKSLTNYNYTCANIGITNNVTLTVSDASSNTATCAAVITVLDTIAPLLTGVPSNANASCSSIPAAATPTKSDNCDSNPSVVFTEVTTEDPNVLNLGHYSYTLTRTWIVADVYSNHRGYVQVITVSDGTAPVLSGVPSNANASCSNIPAPASPTAVDNCDPNPVITYGQVSTQDSDPTHLAHYSYTLTRTWTATDISTNHSSQVQVITVTDGTPPTLSACPNAITINCQDSQLPANTNGSPTATDNCDPNPVITYADVRTDGNCLYNYTLARTWTATDVSGNTSTCNQIITVHDITNPTITHAAEDLTVECDGTGNTATLASWVSSHANSTATDNCGGVTWSNDFTAITHTCGNTGNVTVVFTATDACGHSSSTSSTFTIVDTTNPTIDNTNTASSTVECNGSGNTTARAAWVANNAGATASDACSNVTWSNSIIGSTPGCSTFTGSWTYRFTATDACGHSSSTSSTFTIVDTTNPTIDNTNTASSTVECDGSGNTSARSAWVSNNAGATASDICSSVTWSSAIIGSTPGCSTFTGSWTYRFTATDACGHSSSTSSTFTIVDTTNPTIGTGASDYFAECNGSGNSVQFGLWLNSYGGAIATDNCSNVTWSSSLDSTHNGCSAFTGSRYYTFTATDACGNASTTSAAFTIEDNTPPTITTPSSDNYAECNGSGNSTEFALWLGSHGGGATASDACSGVSWDYVVIHDSTYCSAFTGEWTYMFFATDGCGNASTTTATFYIQDNFGPDIFPDASDLTVSCDGSGNTSAKNAWIANHGGAAATDVCSSVASWSYSLDSMHVGCSTYTGSWFYTFKAFDECGNFSSTTATFTIEDHTAPTIGTLASNSTVECDGSGNTTARAAWVANQGGATATDGCSSVTWSSLITNTVSGCSAFTGAWTYRFTATDGCGNTSTTSAIFAIVDTTPPSIGTQASNSSVECDGSGNTAARAAWVANHGGASATDGCSSVSWSSSITNTTSGCSTFTGAWTYRFTATDGCGNTSTTSAVYTIQDTQAPSISTNVGALNASLECSNSAGITAAIALTPSATDVCSSVTRHLTSDVTTQGSCASNYTRVRIWNFTDDCGNTSGDYTQTITVSDNTAPVITCPSAITINCQASQDPSNTGNATATDNCTVSPTITHSDVSTQGNNPANSNYYNYAITRTWTATDACGNHSSCNQTITVHDVTAPVISCPSNILVNNDAGNCSAVVNLTVTATDNCQTNVTIVNNPPSGSTFAVGAATTVNSTASDASGNTSTCSFTVTVQTETIALSSPLHNGGYNLSCFGGADGSITNTLTNGTGPFTFTWSGPNGYSSTVQSPTGLASGSYFVTVYNGCTRTANINLTQPSPINYSASKVNELCNGGNNGSITIINVTGGITPYTYSDDNGTSYQSSNVFSSLVAATYTVKVKDVNNCLNATSNISVTQPQVITLNITKTNVLCNGNTNGTITVTSGGGTGTKNYSITGGAPYFASGSFSSLAAATYQVVAQDANNCVSAAYPTSITQPALVTFTTVVTNPSPCTASNGKIVVTAAGGAGFYNYSKNSGTNWQSGNSFTPLATGDYPIRVKDPNGCLSVITSVHVGCSVRDIQAEDPAAIGSYMTAYPNPASDQVTVSFGADREANYTLRLTDMLGRIVMTQAGTTAIGSNQVELRVADFAKGVYIIILESGDDTRKSRLVLQ